MNVHGPFDYIPTTESSDEVLFENTHTRDKRFFSEFYTYSFFTRRAFVVIYSLMALLMVISIVELFLTGDCSWLSLLLFPCYLLFVVFMRILSINTSVKRELENGNGAPILYTIRITDHKICWQTSLGTNFEYDLSHVRFVAQTKNYFLLQTAAKQFYPIKKDAFSKGTCESFLAFLRSKNYKVR